MSFICECDSMDCVEDLPITDAEFMAARMVSWRASLVLPGHQSPTDVVVLERDRYLIVTDKKETE